MTQSSKAAKASSASSHRSGAGFGILLSLLIALAAAVGSYWTWQQSNLRDEVQNELEQGVHQLLGAITKQREEINRRFEREQQERKNYNTLQQRLMMLESKVEQANRPQKIDRWSIAEARYLINIAEHHYRLEQNSSMARIALERAYEQLLEYRSAETVAVTEALSRLMAQLKQEDGESRTQALMQLELLAEMIPTLPIAKSARAVKQSRAETTDYSLKSIEGWHHYGNALWIDIQQLFHISRPGASDNEKGWPITAEITPLLRQQLALKLDLARLAVMSSSPLYITTVKEIEGLLENYFDRDSDVIKEQLKVLEQIVGTGERQLPDVDFNTVRQHLAGSRRGQ